MNTNDLRIKIKFTSVFFLFFLCLIQVVLLSACSIAAEQHNPTVDSAKNQMSSKKEKGPSMSLAPIQIIQGAYRLRVVLFSDSCFSSNPTRLTAGCANQLRRAMPIINAYGKGCVQIVGYTDDIQNPAMANTFSQRQADTVASFLCMHGIDSHRLRAIGFSSHDPIACARSLSGAAKNRRVEITLVK